MAEERLYPVALVDPDLYQRAVMLVREVADELRLLPTTELLVEAWDGAAEIVAGVVDRLGLEPGRLDLGLVAGAAFSLRERELAEDEARASALERIRHAREAGEPWVVLYETALAGAGAGSPAPPYRRLEMRLADGFGLHVFVEVDPDTARPVYGVEALQLDPQTGDWVHEAARLAERRTSPDPGPWEAAIQELREQGAER